MNLPNWLSPDKRKATSARWLERKAQLRMERGVDADTLHRRALYDARGQIEREGHTYRAAGVTHWQVRRAMSGRTDQFEFVANGRVKLLGGPRKFPLHFRP